MRKIYKYPVQLDSTRDKPYPVKVRAPAGARPICIMVQRGQICIWMEVDPDATVCDFTFYSVGTGFGAVPEGAAYLGSVTDGELVWHVYY